MESGKRRKGICHGIVKSATWGFLLAILSGIIYSVITVLVKYVKTLHPAQLVVYRYWAVISFSLPQLVFNQENYRCPPGSCFGLLVMTTASATCTFLEFAVFRYLPIGEAVIMICSYPVFVTIAGRIFLKESFGLLQVISLVITIIGLIFVTGLYQALVANSRVYTTEDIYGFAAGLGAIFTVCIVLLLARKLRNVQHSITLFSTGIVGIIEAAIITSLLDSFRIHHKGLEQAFIILLGVAGYLGYMTLIMAAQYADAGLVSILHAGTQIVITLVWQVIIFHDTPDAFTIFGAVLVGISVFLTGFSNKIRRFLPAKCINFC